MTVWNPTKECTWNLFSVDTLCIVFNDIVLCTPCIVKYFVDKAMVRYDFTSQLIEIGINYTDAWESNSGWYSLG